MNIDPYQRASSKKDALQALDRLQKMVMLAPKFMVGCILGLAQYAKRQKVSLNQALDEAVLALPRLYPEGLANLSDWIPRCQEMGIPYIPIEMGPKISVSILEEIADERRPASPDLDPLAEFIAQAYSEGKMWRWDACGPENLKLLAGLRRTEPQHQVLPLIPLGLDERLFHILWQDQATEAQVVARPWVRAQMDEGFPVEFRVFKTPEGEAACNYYPQRELSKKYLPAMEKAVELTRRLAQAKGCPQEFSCDWMLTETGDILFLEGGPGHLSHGGAHPCCFALGMTTPGRRLLQSEPGAQFYLEPRMEKVLKAYTEDQISFTEACKNLRMPPKVAAGLFAFKGIIPREIAEKVITQS